MKRITLLLLLLATFAVAQGDVPLPDLSPEDKLSARNAEVDVLQTFQNVEQTPQWQAYQVAVSQQRSVLGAIFNKHKMDPNQITLCDGPSGPGCEGVSHGDLAFRAPKKAKK